MNKHGTGSHAKDRGVQDGHAQVLRFPDPGFVNGIKQGLGLIFWLVKQT